MFLESMILNPHSKKILNNKSNTEEKTKMTKILKEKFEITYI